MQDRIFSASPDRTVRIVTVLFWVGMLGGTAIAVGAAGAILGVFVVPLVAVLLASPVIVLALAPRRYRLAPDRLVIERLLRPIDIPIAQVASVRPVERAAFGRLIRLFGSGGAHGAFGLFRSSTLGRLQFQMTRLDNMVLIERGDGIPIVVSSDDRDGFVAALRAKLAVARP